MSEHPTETERIAAATAEIERLRSELERAVESRENANAATLRAEAEIARLRTVTDEMINRAQFEACRIGIPGWRSRRNFESVLRAALEAPDA